MIWLYKLKRKNFYFYMKPKFLTVTSVTPGMGIMEIRPISSNMSNINEIPQGSWWYSYINLNTKNFDFFMKILSPWPWPQGHPRGGDGADKNSRPISTIMPNMNEIHQRVFKIWGLINFNAKTLTLWRKDGWTNERTYKRKSKNYIPPHTSYVGGTITRIFCLYNRKLTLKAPITTEYYNMFLRIRKTLFVFWGGFFVIFFYKKYFVKC